MYFHFGIILCLCVVSRTSGKPIQKVSNESYWREREELMDLDLSHMIGHNLTLSSDEAELNDILMTFKDREMNDGFQNLDFLPSQNFISAKTEIEESEIFKIIRRMPKGAALHLHDTAMTSVDWVISELTYWDDLYMCNSSDNYLLFQFFTVPNSVCQWKLVQDERNSYSSPEEFDAYLYSKLSLYTMDVESTYPDINSIWTAFENLFVSVNGIVTYSQAWRRYLERALLEFMEDNITYLEFRGVLPLLYEKDGRIYTEMETVSVYNEVIRNFTNFHSCQFFGTRFIYAPPRLVDVETVWNYVNLVVEMKNQYPDLIAGFDLVGQEDMGKPLKDFLDPILALRDQHPNIEVFFHAGETNWEGMSSDENLFDALLLNSSRIGHGYAITKHPELMAMARTKEVPLEVCPISNQVLKLVEDLRNHPGTYLAASDFPMVVSSDDPAIWEALPLSHDFYEAFMGIGGAKADLKFLKQLAINSIKYSSLNVTEKVSLMTMWEDQWNAFVSETIVEARLSKSEEANVILPKEINDNEII